MLGRYCDIIRSIKFLLATIDAITRMSLPLLLSTKYFPKFWHKNNWINRLDLCGGTISRTPKGLSLLWTAMIEIVLLRPGMSCIGCSMRYVLFLHTCTIIYLSTLLYVDSNLRACLNWLFINFQWENSWVSNNLIPIILNFVPLEDNSVFLFSKFY